jgi:uncharacterized protein YwqG
MDKVGIQNALVAAGLSRLVQDIDRITQVSIRLSTTPVDESRLKTGVSKLGGQPDLPADVRWPQWKGLPQSFIAQIQLDEVRQYDTSNLLPNSGMLWFFYDARQETYGDNPADRGGWHVFFRDDDLSQLKLQRTPFPTTLAESGRFKACSVNFSNEVTISQQPQLEIPGLAWTDADQEAYDKALETLITAADRAAPHHRLLGIPDTIQDDMRQQCQLISNGVTDTNDPRANELSKGALDWQLLLQIDSDEPAGMHWASAGMIYYWIKRADLQGHRFDHTWLVLQSD